MTAAEESSVVLPNGIPRTKRPSMPKGWDMRVAPEDVDGQVAATESPELKVIIRFAVETAMRRSEIVCIRWEHFNLQRRSVYLPETKTDQPWTVPLSTVALELLDGMRPVDAVTVFSLAPDSVTQAFKRAAVRARMGAINFHDLRHEFSQHVFCCAHKKPNSSGTSGLRTDFCVAYRNSQMAERMSISYSGCPRRNASGSSCSAAARRARRSNVRAGILDSIPFYDLNSYPSKSKSIIFLRYRT